MRRALKNAPTTSARKEIAKNKCANARTWEMKWCEPTIHNVIANNVRDAVTAALSAFLALSFT
jgi:hypothetical protein